VLGLQPNQKGRTRDEVNVTAKDLLNLHVEGGHVTEAGVRLNVSVAMQYLDAWLGGNGAAAINNLMEDAATAEISRSQLWQWRSIGARLDDDSIFDELRYREIRDEEVARLGQGAYGHVDDAALLLDGLVLSDEFAEFLTLRAYRLLG
jgi:malate synthase